MNTVTGAREDRGITSLPPGLYVRHSDRVADRAPAWETGVPVFVGFAQPATDALERGRPAAVVVDRWDARAFERSVVPAAGSYLGAAVRGFFANGGERCIVLAVAPVHAGASAGAALLHALRRGGPLDDRSDINLICVPDAALEGVVADEVRAIHTAMLDHCEAMGDRFAVLDTPRAWVHGSEKSISELLYAVSDMRSAFGAMYFPWVAMGPSRDGAGPGDSAAGSEQWRCGPASPGDVFSIEGFVPPCGHVAGLYARLDALIGAQRSPANEMLEGVVDTSAHLTDRQHGQLNEVGVNCLRSLRGRGIRVGGARTLSGHTQWAHVSTARVVINFRRWLAQAMNEFVFEPHTPDLWERIRLKLVSRCVDLQRRGALAGAAGEQGYFVKCDAETNPGDERDLGRVVAHVGLAPSVPAEFIVVRVVHDASGFTVSGLI